MSEWLSYRPSDFILFGPDAYWRLFADTNLALWPLTSAGLVLGVALMRFPQLPSTYRRVVLILLSAAWALIAWHFFARLYAAINWAAPTFALVFGLQAVALLAYACMEEEQEPRGSRVASMLLFYSLLLHPVWPLLTGRNLIQAEILGLAPDPTAIATLGLALFIRGGMILAIIPTLWLGVSATTLLAMRQLEGFAVLAALGIWAIAVLFRGRKSRA